ncbi:4319_t:CDS:1, partial [Gigaspora rosea]
FNVDLYADLNSKEGALNWLSELQGMSKTTMRLRKITKKAESLLLVKLAAYLYQRNSTVTDKG